MSDESRDEKPPSDGTFRCNVDAVLSVVDGKWKLLIVWELLERPLRHGELLARLPSISSKVLTQQLRELQGDGVLRREEGGAGRRTPYALTSFDRTLEPLARTADEWGRLRGDELLTRRNPPGAQADRGEDAG